MNGASPTSVLTDFERAALNAFETIFPNSTLSGYFFHLSSNVWKKIQDVGLQQRYNNDEEFSIHVRMIMRLAFVPVADVVNAFNDLSDEIENQHNNDMDVLLNYFEDTYIGRLHRNGRRAAPIFAFEVWNMYGRTRDELSRTNNHIEGWHRGYQYHINACHPNFWKFLHVMKREENLTRVSIARSLGGHPPAPQQRKHFDCNTRIVNIVQNYPGMPTMIDFRNIAHSHLQK